jgi:hypothetical protein
VTKGDRSDDGRLGRNYLRWLRRCAGGSPASLEEVRGGIEVERVFGGDTERVRKLTE